MKSAKVQILLKKNEHVFAVVPEYCSGPGWGNALLKVYIADGNSGSYRTEFIQPEDQNRDQVVLFKAGETINKSLVESIVLKQEK